MDAGHEKKAEDEKREIIGNVSVAISDSTPLGSAEASESAIRSFPSPSQLPIKSPAPRRLPGSEFQADSSPTQTHDLFSSLSSTSEKQLGQIDPSPNDRVFPIRSVISVDPIQTPFVSPGRTSGEYEAFPGMIPDPLGVETAGNTHPRQTSRGRSNFEPNINQMTSKKTRKSVDSESSAGNAAERINENKTAASGVGRERASSTSGATATSSMYGGGSRMQIFRDATWESSAEKGGDGSVLGSDSTESAQIDPLETRVAGDQEGLPSHVTVRFKHVVTENGHAVITGRDDEIQRCEDEPIHIPGAVQAFGLLIALTEGPDGQLIVRIVSENSKRIIGLTPEQLFKLNSFTDILSDEQAENLLDHVDFIRDGETDPATNGPEVFIITVRIDKKKSPTKLWCAMHINPANPDMIICEFEFDDDQLYPLVPPCQETPEPPEDTLNSMPTEEEFAESTHKSSKPLRVLRSARKRKGEAAAMEVFNIMSQVQEQLASAPNLEQFLKILVGVVKELTGFHRVMIYQFDPTFNGRVVTELVDPRATKDLYKGLNFPASDIPKQARELYKINKVRLLYDRDMETARLVCRTVEEVERPLDLSFSYLRAMSPVHIKYLRNMAVRSSMSISINAFGELWGLITCHSYGTKGMRVSFPIRKMCRLVGDTASRNIERLSYASRLQARKLINTVPTEANPSGYIVASSDDLLKLFDADFGLLSIRNETKILGKIDHSQEVLAMLEYLRLRNITSVVTSQDIGLDFPDLHYPPGFEVIAGMLLVPLSVGGQDFIVFFRKGQIKEVKWAGNPYQKVVKEGTKAYLEPRKSFRTWTETVIGKCREWTEDQVETAAVLCLVYGKFIEVWRQKEAALQSSQLTRLLLANSAHEVRTPLNAIINYLEIALEGSLDIETRENLSKSHSASKSLIYVINDLLDLTKTEEGQGLIKYEIFNLHATVHEVAEAFKGDAKRKGIRYEVILHPGTPQHVYGDQRRVRQVMSNLTANALQNTAEGWICMQLYVVERADRRALVEFVVEDSGVGMSNQKLDALFRDLEQVSTDSGDVLLPDEVNSPSDMKEDGTDKRTLGLGLAIVARIVRNMEGQLRLKSEEGKGSRFVVQLPFEVSEEETEGVNYGTEESVINSIPAEASLHGSQRSSVPIAEGELLLVDKADSFRFENMGRKRSVEDLTSLQSFKSGSSNKSRGSAKSDVDRLIDAISEPHLVGILEPEDNRVQRSNSKGSGNSRRSAGNQGAGHMGSKSISGDDKLERPTKSSRKKLYRSISVPEQIPSDSGTLPGSEFVTDNRTVLTALRVPEEFQEFSPEKSHAQSTSRVLFDIPDSPSPPKASAAQNLQVLVAEDDPINSRIIKKRLEKSGHTVHTTLNGEECASAYSEKPAFFDVVLMDMQMPIVDGLTSTKMIRSHEKSQSQEILSSRASCNGRVPIFAVSASLLERERQTYVDAGFDGWILKPVDFQRLNVLLNGIVDNDIKKDCLYQPGAWERGGWLHHRHFDILRAKAGPLGASPVSSLLSLSADAKQSNLDQLDDGHTDSGEMTPVQRPQKTLSHEDKLNNLDHIS